MKKTLVLVLVLVACFTHIQGQNGGQIIASQYGEFQVAGSSAGGFSFPPATCQVSAGGKNFAAFSTGTPIKIVDSNPNLTEVATPSSVYIGACSVNMATVYNHVPPYYLTSGTGGLQEAITANQTNNGPNTIVLDAEWYKLIAPGNAASIIASVHGIPDLGLEDITTTPYTSYQWNGSQYTVIAAASGAYNEGSAGAITESVTAKLQQSISIKDFGAVGDGTHMAADTAGIKAAVAAAASFGKAVYVPAGNYLLDNSTAAVLSGAQNVLLYGDGPSSSLTCQTIGTNDCIASTGATGFGLLNLAISFGPTATARTSGYALDVQSCSNCLFDGVTLNNGDLSGLRLASSVHTQIHNLAISNFYANGAFTINNQDLRVDGLACQNNQDACFETSWFDSEYAAHGIPCQNITATNITSSNDLETILVNACNNVSVNNFSSIGAAKEAIFVGQDPSTTTAHWPDRISISNGTIYGAGYGTNPLNVSTAPALYFNVGTPPSGFISHVAISSISATHISGWGLQMAELQDTDLQLANATFTDVGNGASGGDGCLDTEGNQVNLANIACTNVGTYGLYDYNTNRLTGSNLTFNGVSQVSGTQSIFLSPTAVGFVGIDGVAINDTNVSAYSSSVYDDTTSGLHSIYGIVSQGIQTPTGPTSLNGGTTYSYSDATHSLVIRNGGQIQSYAPPNFYFLPTAGTTPTSQVPGAVVYYQSKCRATPSGTEETESVGWYDTYPTLTTESFAFNHFGGCSFPITLDFTAANSILEPQTTVTGTVSGQHLGGIASGAYASVPTLTAGTGAGTSPTISLNGNSNDVSGYVSVTPGTSPAANAAVVTITFGTAYSTLAKCSLWAANAAANLLQGTAANVFVPVPSTTAFVLTSGTSALTASTLYTWGYTCTQ
jgi:Pectate lyase superfamily protein